MKKLIVILIGLVVGLEATAQSYPNVTQKYRYLAYFSPAMAGMNDNLDINAGFNFQPSGLDNTLNTNFFSGYYSTGVSQGSRNAIRGTQSVDDYYGRRQRAELKMGFGTAIMSEDVGEITSTYNSNAFAVHVPIADHTYLSMGVAVGFNFRTVNGDRFTARDGGDEVIIEVGQDKNNSSLHIDAGLGVTSDEFYLAVGLNNLTNVYMSGNEILTEKIFISNFMGGYRLYHSNDLEAIVMAMVNVQENFDPAWNVGVRGRYRQILMAGFNYTGDGSFITQLGLQMNDYLNVGYSFAYKGSSTAVVNSIHELGIGLRLMNHNKYVPIW
ncbi:MAG: PorP/SprF family type IX secretion system membrane protein [Cyclobacteriaceae bacterium]